MSLITEENLALIGFMRDTNNPKCYNRHDGQFCFNNGHGILDTQDDGKETYIQFKERIEKEIRDTLKNGQV